MNAENMTSSIMSPKKNYTITVFTSTLRLEIDQLICSREMTVSTSAARASLNYNLDVSWFFL